MEVFIGCQSHGFRLLTDFQKAEKERMRVISGLAICWFRAFYKFISFANSCADHYQKHGCALRCSRHWLQLHIPECLSFLLFWCFFGRCQYLIGRELIGIRIDSWIWTLKKGLHLQHLNPFWIQPLPDGSLRISILLRPGRICMVDWKNLKVCYTSELSGGTLVMNEIVGS